MSIAEMFATEQDTSILKRWDETVQFIAREEATLKALEDQIKKRKSNLDGLKAQLAEEMFQNNAAEGHKFESGLYPKPTVIQKIFKAAGVSDEQLFEFLKRNNLGDIIKPYVHFQTMQSALKEFIDQGGELPTETFNVVDQYSIKMIGKSKYLAGLTEGN